jgi:hypothetical protein
MLSYRLQCAFLSVYRVLLDCLVDATEYIQVLAKFQCHDGLVVIVRAILRRCAQDFSLQDRNAIYLLFDYYEQDRHRMCNLQFPVHLNMHGCDMSAVGINAEKAEHIITESGVGTADKTPTTSCVMQRLEISTPIH